jgi:hypothetical protein
MRLINEQDHVPALLALLVRGLRELAEHGGGTAGRTGESTFLAQEHEHIAKREFRVVKQDQLGTWRPSGLARAKDRRLAQSWGPE